MVVELENIKIFDGCLSYINLLDPSPWLYLFKNKRRNNS